MDFINTGFYKNMIVLRFGDHDAIHIFSICASGDSVRMATSFKSNSSYINGNYGNSKYFNLGGL